MSCYAIIEVGCIECCDPTVFLSVTPFRPTTIPVLTLEESSAVVDYIYDIVALEVDSAPTNGREHVVSTFVPVSPDWMEYIKEDPTQVGMFLARVKRYHDAALSGAARQSETITFVVRSDDGRSAKIVSHTTAYAQ